MLSRVANALYWMVRNVERADNLARMLEVNEQLLLDVDHIDLPRFEAFWRPIVQSTGDDTLFEELYPKGRSAEIIEFLCIDKANPNSIRSCIGQARENARTVRDQLSEAIWEELNGLFLFLNSPDADALLSANPQHFHETIRKSANVFNGIISSNLSRDNAWDFMELGRNMERADKITRILDFTTFLPKEGAEASLIDHHWNATLRACGARSSFQIRFRNHPTPQNIIDFLIFDRNFPRSVRFCIDSADAALHRISGSQRGSFSNEAERASGRLLASLAYGSVDEVLETGLHDYLDGLQTQFNRIGDEIFREYVLLPDSDESVPPIPGESISAVVAWQIQQQQQQQQ
ncbi:alpha-E domain-containing protein [Haloferula sp.]|uniref:alpha-E domain-containing protein n=1 Tax=Haloferula sp. TaxID=2497595 RepID=UPI003C707504